MDIDWLPPWGPIEDPVFARTVEEELANEVAKDHPLYGIPVSAVGKHSATEDVLFRLCDGSRFYVIVHLSWTGKKERPPYPLSMGFDDLASWVENGMKLDHEEFMASGM